MKKFLLIFLIAIQVCLGFNVLNVNAAQTYRIHFYNSDNWTNVYVYTWRKTASGDQRIGPAWPGVPATKEADSSWWFIDLPLEVGDHVIFNSNNQKPQAADLVLKETLEIFACKVADEQTHTLIHYQDKESAEVAVGELEPIDPNTMTKIWFYNSQGWAKVYIYAYGGSFENEAAGPWPGKLTVRDNKTHWYSFDVNTALPVHIIFSDGSDQNKAEAYVTENVYMTIGNDLTYLSKEIAEATIDEVLPIPEEVVEEPTEVVNRFVENTNTVDYVYQNPNDQLIDYIVIVITSLLGSLFILFAVCLILYKVDKELFFKIGVIKWLLQRVKI